MKFINLSGHLKVDSRFSHQVQARLAEIDNGAVQTIPGDIALVQIQNFR